MTERNPESSYLSKEQYKAIAAALTKEFVSTLMEIPGFNQVAVLHYFEIPRPTNPLFRELRFSGHEGEHWRILDDHKLGGILYIARDFTINGRDFKQSLSLGEHVNKSIIYDDNSNVTKGGEVDNQAAKTGAENLLEKLKALIPPKKISTRG